jgi:predicted RNA-binding Zn-ribbon protein involved in translation (DUF1610 family)
MTNRKCPDCGGEMTQIKLFGRSWENPLSGVALDADVGFYTDVEADRGTFTGKFKPKGTVESFLCSSCGRVVMFGAPD